MLRRLTAIVVGVTLVAGVSLVTAHHSVRATFDDSKIVKITGIVMRIDWPNPHVFIFVQAKDESSVWILQMRAPGGLIGTGFDKSLLNIGDQVRLDLWVAKKTG
jgi:hypothetical protein